MNLRNEGMKAEVVSSVIGFGCTACIEKDTKIATYPLIMMGLRMYPLLI